MTDALVRDQAAAYLSAYDGPARLSQVELGDRTGSADGASATVELTAVARLPIAASVVAAWNGGIAITVTSTARASLAP